jgi:outer membrane protein assembly factor BamB
MLQPVWTLTLALTFSGDPDAPSWRGFRGNDGSGVAVAAKIPQSLDVEANGLWRTEIAPGYSSPIVDGGRVYLTASEGKQLLTLAVDAVTGEILWKKGVEFDGSRIGANSSAAPTPATDGVRVYAFFHHVGLVAYDLEGKELWRNSVGSPYDIPHGMASSPVVSGGKVVLQIDQDSSSRLLALDAATGMQVWETARPGVTHGYSTPVIHTPEGGEPQVVV